jgi:hypothetical protein
LNDAFEVNWSDVHKWGTKWAENNIGGKKGAVQKLFALMLSGGPRKTAILDPNVQFYTIEQWEKKTNTSVEDGFFFGSEDTNIQIDLAKWRKLVGNDYILVQHGKLKDKKQSVNPFLLKGDSKWVENTVIFKPTLMLKASLYVQMVAEVRKHFGTTKAVIGMTREKLGSKVGTRDYKVQLQKAFPNAAAKALKNNWDFGTHILRKIYVNAACDIFKQQLRQVTGKLADRGVIMQTFLAHEGSLGTFLSYANLVVNFDTKIKERFSLPPDHLVRLFTNDLEFLKEENRQLRAEMAEMKQMMILVLNKPTALNAPDTDLRHFQGTAEEKYIAGVKLLEKNRLKVSVKNLRGLGIGNGTISKCRNKFANKGLPVEKSEKEEKVEEPVVAMTDDDGDLGYKVIVPKMPDSVPRSDYPNNNAGTKQFKAATKLANAERTKRNRDVKKFGESNVTTAEDCDGQIQKKLKIAKGIVRDVCL